MACEPWVQVVLPEVLGEGQSFLVYASYEYNVIVERTEFEVPSDRAGQFRFTIPSSDGTLSLHLITRDAEKCKIKYFSECRKTITPGSNVINISKENDDLTLLDPRRCNCDAGWCVVNEAFLTSGSYRAVTGHQDRILIGGSNETGGVIYEYYKGWRNLVGQGKRINHVTSMWTEPKEMRSWITTSKTPSDIYVFTHGKDKELGEPLDTKETPSSPMLPSYEVISPIIEKISGDTRTGKLQLVGRSSKDDEKAILIQRDSGNVWSNDIYSLGIPPRSSLYGIWVHPAGSEIWAVGDAGLVVNRRGGNYVIVDYSIGGINQKTQEALRTIWCLDEGSCWLAGDDGIIYATATDPSKPLGKLNFTVQYKPSIDKENKKINSIWGIDKNHIWAAGENGTILSYDGNRWTASKRGTANLKDVWGKDEDNIWIVGDNGTVLISDPTTGIFK
jgi:hypothetical protein